MSNEIQNLQAQIDEIKGKLCEVASLLNGFCAPATPKKKTGLYAVIEGQNGAPGWVHAYHWQEADWEYMNANEKDPGSVTAHMGDVKVGWLVNGPGMVNVPITALDPDGKKVWVEGNLPWVENWGPTNGGYGDRYNDKFSEQAWYTFTEN